MGSAPPPFGSGYGDVKGIKYLYMYLFVDEKETIGKVNEEEGRRIRSYNTAPATRTCKCLVNDPTPNSPLAKTSGKDVRKFDLNWFIDNKIISKKSHASV